MKKMIEGKVYVLGDNVDTDQIIPAEYLMHNPSVPEERRMFGRFALSGVPAEVAGLPHGNVTFVDQANPNNTKSEFSVIVAGRNFGCGSSREHAPLALAEAGIRAVVTEFYARIFYRNCVNGGYLVPLESQQRLVEAFETGDEVQIDLQSGQIRNLTRQREYPLRPIGDVLPIIEAGGLFAYAKNAGLI